MFLMSRLFSIDNGIKEINTVNVISPFQAKYHINLKKNFRILSDL